MILGPECSTIATPASGAGRSDRGKIGLFAGGIGAPFSAVNRGKPGTTRSRIFGVSIQCSGSIGFGSRRISRSLRNSIGDAHAWCLARRSHGADARHRAVVRRRCVEPFGVGPALRVHADAELTGAVRDNNESLSRRSSQIGADRAPSLATRTGFGGIEKPGRPPFVEATRPVFVGGEERYLTVRGLVAAAEEGCSPALRRAFPGLSHSGASRWRGCAETPVATCLARCKTRRSDRCRFAG